MRGAPRKLTDDQVDTVRNWRASYDAARAALAALPQPREVAAEMGISKAALYLIAGGYTYKKPSKV
jgi:hypothetical protein